MKSHLLIIVALTFLFLGCDADIKPPADSRTMEFEYLAVAEADFLAPFSDLNGSEAVTSALNQKASQGWELIQVDRKYHRINPSYTLRSPGPRLDDLKIIDSTSYIFRRMK